MRVSSKNPADGIASSQKYFTEDEIDSIMRVLSRTQDILLARVGLDLGARVGEIVGLKWTDIDFKNRVVRIWDEKKDRERLAVMTEPTWRLLEEYAKLTDKRSQKFVFPFSHDTANRRIKRWARDAGIVRRVRWHMMRHTHIVQSRRVGRDWNWLAQQTGDVVATLISEYSQLSLEDRQKLGDETPIIKE